MNRAENVGTVQVRIFYTGVDTDSFKDFMGSMVLIAVLFNADVRRKVASSPVSGMSDNESELRTIGAV